MNMCTSWYNGKRGEIYLLSLQHTYYNWNNLVAGIGMAMAKLKDKGDETLGGKIKCMM